MKRSSLFVLFVLVLAAAPAWAEGPSATKAVKATDETITTFAITVASDGDEVFGVNIKGAKMEDIRAPKGWVGISSGSSVIFRTGENPVTSGNSLDFTILTSEASASLTVSFRGKDDAVGKPVTL